MFFILSFLFFLLQNGRIEVLNKSCPGVEGWHQWEEGGIGERE
jgi:hypothetical protein